MSWALMGYGFRQEVGLWLYICRHPLMNVRAACAWMQQQQQPSVSYSADHAGSPGHNAQHGGMAT